LDDVGGQFGLSLLLPIQEVVELVEWEVIHGRAPESEHADARYGLRLIVAKRTFVACAVPAI